jgi:hypothetical protein
MRIENGFALAPSALGLGTVRGADALQGEQASPGSMPTAPSAGIEMLRMMVIAARGIGCASALAHGLHRWRLVALKPPRYLKTGGVIELGIKGLGTQKQTFRADI